MNHEGGPQIKKETEKQKQWEQALKNLETIADGLGLPIEQSIKETVAALNVNEVPTSSSCGGHIEDGRLSFPYVGGEAFHQPQYRYQGEAKIIKDLIEKYHLLYRHEIFDDGKVENEYYNLIDGLDETEEYKEWYLKNEPLEQRVLKLIEEFNATRTNARICLTPIHPGYRMEAHDRHMEFIDVKQKESEIKFAQEEFRMFTEFLKQRFLKH